MTVLATLFIPCSFGDLIDKCLQRANWSLNMRKLAGVVSFVVALCFQYVVCSAISGATLGPILTDSLRTIEMAVFVELDSFASIAYAAATGLFIFVLCLAAFCLRYLAILMACTLFCLKHPFGTLAIAIVAVAILAKREH